MLENENRHLTQRHTIGVLAITMSVVKRSGGSETLFSALVMRCVSEKSTRISVKSQMCFQWLQVLISEVLLI